ncbi:MAG: Arc family DNA-binding protein [Holophaga sp.]|jgi:plasmid stability protein
MPNLHLRDLPDETLAILKQAARTDGRSLNAELVHLLNQEADHLRRAQDFLAQVKPRKLRRPVDLEALIREDRESRPGGPA